MSCAALVGTEVQCPCRRMGVGSQTLVNGVSSHGFGQRAKPAQRDEADLAVLLGLKQK